MSDEAEAEETFEIRLVYAGRRDKDKALFYINGLEDQTEGARLHYSSKMKAHAIGGLYTVQAVDEKGQRIFPTTLTYANTGVVVDSDVVARWQLEDRACRMQVESEKAERRLAKSNELDAVMEPLLRFTAGLRTRNELAALDKVVRDRMAEAYWRDR